MYPATIGQSFPKQLKCQSLQCGMAGREGKNLPDKLACQSNLRCGKAARVVLSNRRQSARLKLKTRLFPRQATARIRCPIKAAPVTGKLTGNAGRPRNLAGGSGVSQPSVASKNANRDANAEMPTIYTPNEFALIRLHPRSARTISDSVTTRERVGRSMSESASTQGETIMNSSLNHGSAKIYQFPAGGRAALGGRRTGEAKPAVEQSSPRMTEVTVGGAWYHDAAIQESKPAWER